MPQESSDSRAMHAGNSANVLIIVDWFLFVMLFKKKKKNDPQKILFLDIIWIKVQILE